jgi:alginate O-acetyltransferase complex protein AlgI
MLFNSFPFLFLFLPLALIGFYTTARIGQRVATAWLVAASFVFYAWWNPAFVVLLAGSIAFNYVCSRWILRWQGRERLQTAVIILAITADLLLLFYYKYLFPILGWFDMQGLHLFDHAAGVILPLGISFFTFTQLGYLVDCKGGIVKQGGLLDYILFVTFFPHLIAGPILHHREVMPQFADPSTYRLKIENITVGATLFIMGLFKKVVIADRFAPLANDLFANPQGIGFFHAWYAAFTYAMQLYFDFSGYSDMAVGLARLFGVVFPANFDSPFRAPCTIEFWQRWHMSLTRYLTQYLYSPVALWVTRRRMAQGKPIAKKGISTLEGFLSMIAFPTFFTMGLIGIWHGAGIQFLIFGLLNGFYLTVNHAWRSFGPRAPADLHPAARALIDAGKIWLTFLAFVVSLIFFRSASVAEGVHFINAMVGRCGLFNQASYAGSTPDLIDVLFHPGLHLGGFDMHQQAAHFAALAFAFLVVWTLPNTLLMLRHYHPTLSKIHPDSPISLAWRPTLAWGLVIGVAATVALLALTGNTVFLYFQF